MAALRDVLYSLKRSEIEIHFDETATCTKLTAHLSAAYSIRWPLLLLLSTCCCFTKWIATQMNIYDPFLSIFIRIITLEINSFLKNAWNAGGSYFFQKDFFKNKIQLYSSIISLNINRILIVLETKCFWFDPSAYPLNQCQIRGSCFLIGCQGPFLDKILKNSKSTSFDGEFDADYENLIFRIF